MTVPHVAPVGRARAAAHTSVTRLSPGTPSMADSDFKILVVGGQAEDVRMVDGAVRDLGVPVDWIEPADVPDRLERDLLLVVLDLDNPGLAAARVFRDDPATRHTPLVF